MTTIKSTAAIRKAQDATAATVTYWADAYAATAQDIADGATVREIAAAWKTARITPANKDSVGDFADASRLSVYGADYSKAIAGVFGEGTIKPAHYLTMKARKERGRAYVLAVLSALEDTIAAMESLDEELVVKAITKAIRTLDAAKREPKVDVTDEATDEATGEATDEATGDEATGSTANDRADAVIALLAGMVKSGDVPDSDRRRTMVESMRALMAAWKADAQAA